MGEGFGARLRGLGRVGGRGLIDLVLPPLCLACRRPVRDPHGLCAACWSKLSFITPPFCIRLGTPMEADLGPDALSAEAIADPPAFARARAAVRYCDIAERLVAGLKYADRLEIAPAMARWMGAAGREILEEADALVPVAIHWRRRVARRFNQAALLADHVGRAAGRPVLPFALTRPVHRPPQVGLDRADRRRNVQGVFQVPREERTAIHGKRLVLIDDVLTTGATVDAASRVLLRAGALRVDVLTFARVVETV